MNRTTVIAIALLGIGLAMVAPVTAASLTLITYARPDDKAGQLVQSGAFEDQVLEEDVKAGGAINQIELPPEITVTSIFVTWADATQTAFPIILASSFANTTVQLYLIEPDHAERPTKEMIQQRCLGQAPAGISGTFEMLFACKAFALALEPAEKWDPDYRGAIQGWLVANYQLFTRAQPVSPYGVDPDLLTRIEEALDKEGQERRGDQKWLPLRLSDARDLIGLSKTASVRLAGVLPELVRENRIEEAIKINDKALEEYRALGRKEPISGINETLLLQNEARFRSLAVAPE